MKKLLVAMLLLYPLSAVAQTYEWTDHQGGVHFTDDRNRIPKKYRKKVRVLGENTGQPLISETTSGKKKSSKGEEAEKEKGKNLYGGKDETAWRNEFKSARGAVQRTEADISELRGRLADTSNMSRSEYLTLQATLNHLQSRLDGQQQKLDQLQESADKAGVPAEIR
jgi:hypothetical protein